MNETTDWGSALAILSAGLVLGMMFVYFFARRRSAAPPSDLAMRDLEAKREALLEQLRAEVVPEERTRLERETAQVLRAIDEHRVHSPRVEPQRVEVAPVTPRQAALTGFAWGAGSILVLGGLAYFVMQAATPREDAGQQAMQAAPAPQADQVVLQLEEAIRQSPENLGARISLAQAYLERDNLMGVFEQTQFVLSRNPQDAKALTFQALVRMSMGQQAEALEMLQRATKSDPNLLDSWVALAWVHTQDGKPKEAEAAMQEAIRRRPEEKQRLEQVLAEMKTHLNTDRTAQNQLPPDHPPVAPPPTAAVAAAPSPAPPAAAQDAKAVRITVELDPAAKSRSGVIYVIARPAGVSGGPPVAVKRVNASSLPVTFDFSASDSMMGQPLPASMRIEARLDSDGDAATRNPTDPFAAQDAVVTGSVLKLALK